MRKIMTLKGRREQKRKKKVNTGKKRGRIEKTVFSDFVLTEEWKGGLCLVWDCE